MKHKKHFNVIERNRSVIIGLVVLVFCPKCGTEFSNDVEICENCGEILEEEVQLMKMIEFGGTLFAVSLLLLISAIILLIFKLMNGYILCIYVFLLSLFFIVGTTKWIINSLRARKLLENVETVYCPECREKKVFKENFCFNCGYKISDVLFYEYLGGIFLEINRNYLRVFKKVRGKGGEIIRLPNPTIYELKHIESPEITKCKGKIFEKDCLKFDYNSETVEIPIKKEIVPMLEDLLLRNSRDGT